MSPADDIDSPGRTGGDSLPSSTWGEPRTLEVIDPAIDREAVDSTGRVGAIAYPYAVYAASVRVPRPVFDARVDEYVVSVDRTRRLALRVDAVPAVREVDLRDCHVLEPAVSLSRRAARRLAMPSSSGRSGGFRLPNRRPSTSIVRSLATSCSGSPNGRTVT